MNIVNYKSLRDLNTFKINVNAESFINIQSEKQIFELLENKNIVNKKIFVLGGGSNILLTKDIKGLVIHNQIKGIKIKNETNKFIIVEVGAGEIWDRFVAQASNWGLLQII